MEEGEMAQKGLKEGKIRGQSREEEEKEKVQCRENRIGLDEEIIDQFRYIRIQPKTIDLSTRLRGIITDLQSFCVIWSKVIKK